MIEEVKEFILSDDKGRAAIVSRFLEDDPILPFNAKVEDITSCYGFPLLTMKACYHCNTERGRDPVGECESCGSVLLEERPEFDMGEG